MKIQFEVSDQIPGAPENIYSAWLDSKKHAAMTGGQANVSSKAGDPFDAWDGYIQGKNLVLEYPRRILQSWRTTEFAEDEQDSLLEILFDTAGDGTKITIRHSNLPEHGMQYKQGWIDAYFIPLKTYFGVTTLRD